MDKMTVGYLTGTKHLISLDVAARWVPRERIPIVEIDQVASMCGTCRGVNGGCPEWAPYFDLITPSLPGIFIIDVTIDMAWAIMWAYRKPNSNVIGHNYFRCGYADILTDRYIKKLLAMVTEAYAEADMGSRVYPLGVGHCPGCRSKKACTVLRGEQCINTRGRMYSIEATGVECSELNKELYGQRLPWWYKSPELPMYMRRYAGIFCHSEVSGVLEVLLREAMTKHRSYVSEGPERMPEYPADMVSAPDTSIDAGLSYPAYTDF